MSRKDRVAKGSVPLPVLTGRAQSREGRRGNGGWRPGARCRRAPLTASPGERHVHEAGAGPMGNFQ